MNSCCQCRRGDIRKCIPFFIAGVVFLAVGLPIMIVGIVVQVFYADFLAYIGGVSIFFGILFVFVWHMITIPAEDKEALNDEIVAGQNNFAFAHDSADLCDDETISKMSRKSKSSISYDDVRLEDTTVAQQDSQSEYSRTAHVRRNETLRVSSTTSLSLSSDTYAETGFNAYEDINTKNS